MSTIGRRPAEYAFWQTPDKSITVTYSLPLFHEIDFVVSEGYRRIPHGGMEVAGLLFGETSEGSIRLKAFRAIECEHASGPSFVLSARDLERLQTQLTTLKTDPELSGLEPVGWFVAHTRSPFEMTEREAAWINQFFPAGLRVAVLVKPERFQATRFLFIVRLQNGAWLLEAAQDPVILPLSGATSRTDSDGAKESPLPSIAASPVTPVPAAPQATLPVSSPPSSPPPSLPNLSDRPTRVVTPRFTEARVLEPQPPSPHDRASEVVRPLTRSDEIWRQRVENFPVLPAARPPAAITPVPRPPVGPAAPIYIPLPPARDPRRRTRSRRPWLGVVLLLAALLGGGLGYAVYVRLPPATIPLAVRSQSTNLIVSWPADQTRNVADATLQVGTASPFTLTQEQKSTGEAPIPSDGKDVKIELVAHHWPRDSHGLLLVVLSPAPSASPSTAKPDQPPPASPQQ